MKSALSLTALFFATLLSCMISRAETAAASLDGKSAGTAAETFLAGYIKELVKNSDHTAWVAKTKLATPEFKAAFKKAMSDKELEVDPVIFAQDVPITPFKAESSKVNGDTATVLVVGKYNEKEFSKLTVTLVAKDGKWLVSKVARLK